MSVAASRIARLEAAREAAHVRRFEAEADAAGTRAPTPGVRGLTTAEQEARIADGYGLRVQELRALIDADAADFRRGARYADLRVARLVPRWATDGAEGPR